jgi:hypothetical protein
MSAIATPAVCDAAAAYLNCLVAPESRQRWVKKGYSVPIDTTPAELASWGANPVAQEFYTQGLATPDANFYDLHTTLPESVAGSLSGTATPRQWGGNGGRVPDQDANGLGCRWRQRRAPEALN